MSRRQTVPITQEKVPGIGAKEVVKETHPSWALAAVHRHQISPPGSVLFDSDIRHQHTVVLSIATASRTRDLSSDWPCREKEFLEIEMSEAQWASLVSAVGTGTGVPVTIRRREDEVFVPGQPFESRMRESLSEVQAAAEKAFADVREAFDRYDEKRNAENRRHLKYAIQNAAGKMTFPAERLTDHVENVVQKARSDVEAFVAGKAAQLGLEPGDVMAEAPQLDVGDGGAS